MQTRWGFSVRCLLAIALAMSLAACDGLGLILKAGDVYGTDRPGDTPTDPTVPPPNLSARFSGAWIASFGDDRTGQDAVTGVNQYAVRITLTQSGNQLSGSGRMLRSVRFGSVASDVVPIRVTGTASGNDASLLFESVAANELDFAQDWDLRLAGDRMQGIYIAEDLSGTLQRSGHALWYRARNATVSDNWVSAFGDASFVPGQAREVRTAVMELSEDASMMLNGVGNFITKSNAMSDTKVTELQEFNVVRGAVEDRDVGFTFGDLDLATREMDLFGFVTDATLATAYAQFNAENTLTQLGHAQWYRAGPVTPTAINHTWVVSFRDTLVSDAALALGRRRSDYLVRVALTAQQGGGITGSGTLLDEGGYLDLDAATWPDVRPLRVENAGVTGTRVSLELVGAQVRMVWDLRLGDGIMVGTYEHFDGMGRFVSAGTGEWRVSSRVLMAGTWVVAYFDTFNTVEPEVTQLLLITINNQDDTEGTTSGVGTLRFAGENSRRTLSVIGEFTGIDVQWILRGSDLFGDTVWNLHQAGNVLYGTYTNENSAGGVESKGSGTWIRAIADDE